MFDEARFVLYIFHIVVNIFPFMLAEAITNAV